MAKIKNLSAVLVYHEAYEPTEEEPIRHEYWFFYKRKKIDLDWGETGHVPNTGDLFIVEELDKDFRLKGIIQTT